MYNENIAIADMNGDGKKAVIPVIALDTLKSVDKGATSGVIFPF